MKVLKYCKICFWVTIVGLCLTSCIKEDAYKKFQEGGEITYVGMLDSVFAQSGKERINLQMYLGHDASVTLVKVYWNDGADSAQVEVPRPATSKLLNLLIPNLTVRSYNFKIYTLDKNRNSSVVKNFSGVTYGEDYEKSLVNRRLKSITRNATADSLILNWADPGQGLIHTEVSYVKKDGDTVHVVVPAVKNKTIIPGDYLVGSILSHRSTYKFNERAFDSFTVHEPLTVVLDELMNYGK